MNTKISGLLALLAGATALTGCATPQPALDHANNGAALMGSMQAELQNFRRVQSAIAQSRLDSVRQQRVLLATYDSAGGFDDRLLRASGQKDLVALYTTLRELSESRLQDEIKLQATISDIDRLLGEVIQPLPEQDKNIAAAQKSVAAMGEELSFKTRLAEAAAFAKEIQKSIDENKEKIEESSTQTPVATMQPPPADKKQEHDAP